MSRRSSTGSRARPRSRAAAAPDAGGLALHLDAFSGIAGNMFLGALLDLGLSRAELEADLAGLALPHTLLVKRVRRGALGALYVDVKAPGPRAPASRRRKAHDRGHAGDPAHPHEGVHAEPHAHAGPHPHAGPGPHPHEHGRSYTAICRVIERARLAPAVRERALAIFEALARAEARVHRRPIEDVHFHEVGAVDAIVDVTGAAIGLARLGVTQVSCSPVALGHGAVDTQHGRLPLPAPATLELLRGIPTVPAHVPWETVTPTGAAILRTIVEAWGPLPAMVPERVGYGAGNDRPGPMPNVVRATLGRTGGASADRIVSIETNLDDLVPEHFDWLLERLFEAGALDVALQHQQMKKNRPGFLVRVLARPSDRARLAAVLFAESTAIGVRTIEYDRLVLARETMRVDTRFGPIAVKVVHGAAGRAEPSAEYEDCKAAARRHGAPLRDVVRAAEDAARAALAAAR
jgi:hypothetical protein